MSDTTPEAVATMVRWLRYGDPDEARERQAADLLEALAARLAEVIEVGGNAQALSNAAYDGLSSLLLSVQQDCIKERARAEALATRLAEAEAERVAEWNRRRDADGSRDVARAACDAMRAERDAALAEVQRLRTAQGAAGVLLEQDDKLLMNAADTGLEDVMQADDPISNYFIVFRAILRALNQETSNGQ